MLTNDAINEHYESSAVITKTLLLHQSLTLSFLIRYKRLNGNIYDIRRCVKSKYLIQGRFYIQILS